MKSFLALIAFIFSSVAFSQQAYLNVNLHPTVSLETENLSLQCIESEKSLHALLKFKTFIVPPGELLRFEILNYKSDQTYALFYMNDQKKTSHKD